jgi:hypothetical protein
MEFEDKVKLYNKYNILYNYLYCDDELSDEFIVIYNILLNIPKFDENIINKIFNFYLIKEFQKLKIFFEIPNKLNDNYYTEIIKNNKINIIDKLLINSNYFILFIFNNFNKFDKYIIIDIISKITYLNDAKYLLNNDKLQNILFNKLINNIFINNIFKILEYEELKKIVHKVPNEFLLLFGNNIIKNNINQNIFLSLDWHKNTILHNILEINGYSSIQYIWKNLSANIKKKILNYRNRRGLTINDMIKPSKNIKLLK